MSVSRVFPVAGLIIWPFSMLPQENQPPGSPTLTMGNGGLYDIYGPLPLNEFSFLPVILGTIAVICLLAMFFCLRRRKRSGPVPQSAGARALAELNAIQVLIDQPLVYMEQLADILRRYLETRFGIASTSKTTGELLLALRQDNLPADARSIDLYSPTLTTCLECSDRAKFAHRLPDRAMMMEFQLTIRDLIKQNETIPSGEEQT